MARWLMVFLATTLSVSASCGGGGGGGGGGNPTSPSGGGSGVTQATFVDEGPHFGGVHPAPIVIAGTTYVYQNTGTAGTSVQASQDGVSFSPMPAAFPAGISRTIVPTGDGHFRMYYFADSTTVDVSSALSSDGLNWTVEPGTRYSDPAIGAIRATALPTGGVRLYYPNGIGITSAFSADGLAFASEGSITITPADATFSWGPSTAAYVNGQFHMILTRTPTSTGVSELWHAASADGRTWTVDRSVLATNPGVPLNQPAWGVNGATPRVYYRAQNGGSNVIGSGVVRF